jgi:4-hydroxy-3-methylbut-2-enyl diphosphate reductase
VNGDRLVVVTALRSEYVALRGHVGGAQLIRCGIGAPEGRRWAGRLAGGHTRAVAVAGVAGGLDPALATGDVVVATEVRDDRGRIVLRGAAPLAAELRRMGMRVHTGPMVSCARIAGGEHRSRLAASGALAVDMESAAVARAALTAGRVPVAVVRVVVDTAYTPVVHPATVPTGLRALLTLRRIGPALDRWASLVRPRQVLLAGPRSFCAGVERAIDIVERALRRYPHPVYVRRQIVHNAHVVADLQRQGAVFVDELDEVPDGTTVVFSAHGVAPAVRQEAARRGLRVVDATCPLVAKVHAEARRFAARGDTVVLIGHDGHEETVGTLGEAPGRITLLQTAQDVDRVVTEPGSKVSYLTQTTLAVDEAAGIVGALRERFPTASGPATDDICYATTNRQEAVRAVAADADVVLVLGSTNSSNSLRLVEVAERTGTPAHLIDDATRILPEWIAAARTVANTAGASAPPHLVDEVIGTLDDLGPVEVSERAVTHEDIRFGLPKEVVD